MTLRQQYPALDTATLASQYAPRSQAGIGADLFSLGVSMTRLYQAEQQAEQDSRAYVSYDYMHAPTPAMLSAYADADRRGVTGD